MVDHVLAGRRTCRRPCSPISSTTTCARRPRGESPEGRGRRVERDSGASCAPNAGHDFGSYKRSTQRRRIQRRMGLRDIETARRLHGGAAGQAGRGRGAGRRSDDQRHRVLPRRRGVAGRSAELVIAPLVASAGAVPRSGSGSRPARPARRPIRVAMLVTEQAEAAGKRSDLKVFATDIAGGQSPHGARTASIPAPPSRRASTRAAAALLRQGRRAPTRSPRSCATWWCSRAQNLLRDPPFSRLDLVTCRNLLIYLEPDAQQKVIALLPFRAARGRAPVSRQRRDDRRGTTTCSRRSRRSGGSIAGIGPPGTT